MGIFTFNNVMAAIQSHGLSESFLLPMILNMSITGSLAILLVLLVRVALKCAPKIFSYALWAVVLFRLLCPVSITTDFSLLGLFDTPTMENTEHTTAMEYVPFDVVHTRDLEVHLPVAPIVNEVVNDVLPQEHAALGADPLEGEMAIASFVWLLGMGTMAVYSVVSYLGLRRRLLTASPLRANIYLADEITSPFVMGLVRPKIYLPSDMEEREQAYIIRHEQHHIRRCDHIIKALAFLALSIHWFNPLVWVAFIYSNKDMEMSCDEAVVKKMGDGILADYAASLLSLATGKHIIAGMPLAFGEGDTKGRIKNLSKWKKPTVWVVLIAVVACVVFAVCTLTNPVSKNTIVMGANYDIEEVLYAVTVGDEISAEPPLQYCVTADYNLYYQQTEGEDWNYLGALAPYKLTNDELNRYMPVDDMRKDAKVRQITDAYILKVKNDNFYLVFQTKDGKTYLAYGWEDVGERGQAGSDDTRLRRLYLLDSSFHSGYVNVNFFQRSLINTVGSYVYSFASFESDKIPGYHITGFKSGASPDHTEMNDLGFAVFQTTGEGYRLIDCKVYENAALVENGIFFCSDPAVADINGEMRNDNTFDILLILNEEVDKVERVYHAEGKEDFAQADTYINAPYMSVWSWELSDAATSVSQYVYDKDGNKLSYDSVIPLNSASWQDLPNGTDGTVTEWFDYLETPDEMNWTDSIEISLPEFPDVIFRWSYGEIAAVKGNETTSLYTGMPIWNTYFCDLSGDGLPELCSTISWGSGMIDNRVIIYDYANGVSYSLEDRGFADYTLRQNKTDGQLYVDKTAHVGGGLLSTGRLVFEDDCLQVLWPEKPNDYIREITDPTDAPNFAYDTAVEKIYEDERNEYFISGLYSQHIIVQYTDGTQEDIVTALNAGRATFADLDKFGIRYWAEPKPTSFDIAENTVAEIGRGTLKSAVELSDEDAAGLLSLIESGYWVEAMDTSDCNNDCAVNLGGRLIYYCSECGTFTEYRLSEVSTMSHQTTTSARFWTMPLSDQLFVNNILCKYIDLMYGVTDVPAPS